MRKLLLALLLVATQTMSAATLTFSKNTPFEAKLSALRVAEKYEKAGAALPRICIIWAQHSTRHLGFFDYAHAEPRRSGRYVVYVNAYHYQWPRWEISFDLLLLHEFGHAIGWPHDTPDSVMELPLEDHLRQKDLLRLSQ